MVNADEASQGEGAEDSPAAETIAHLFHEHNRALVGYLRARLRSEQEAKEVAQEAYVRLLQAPATTVRADIGQRVTFSRPARRLSVAAVDPRIAESWRDGTLQYVGEPLEDVVSDVNRYSRRKIVVAPALLQSRFTGTVSTADVGDWLAALQQIFPVDVVDQGSKGILIQSRDNNGTRK